MRKLVSATLFIVSVHAGSGCAVPDKDTNRLTTLEREAPRLSKLLDQSRKAGRRPSKAELVTIGGVPVGRTSNVAAGEPLMTINTALSVEAPIVYYFPEDDAYYLSSRWYWNTLGFADGTLHLSVCGWCSDMHFTGLAGLVDIGGLDAFGIHYSRPVIDIYSDTFQCNFSPDTECSIVSDNRAEANEQNVVHTFQEKAGMIVEDVFHPFDPARNTPLINVAQGDIFHAFRPTDSTCLQVWATYTHTYDDTKITGFSLGAEALGVQWSPADSAWMKVSPGSDVFCPPGG